ncbi:hypothetical protein [Desulfopila sp. IMCC35008]|uniref:hypothetical protein n=1 Tax=Desulfopila sp. IMCC35008 TaxID=2653858 RepID=UPI0013D339D5|nr:hypothetical protein [Desulfopila sp. IMCC35008]
MPKLPSLLLSNQLDINMFDGMPVTPLNTSSPLTTVIFMPVFTSLALTLQKDFCRQAIVAKQTYCPQMKALTPSAVITKHTNMHHFPVKDPYERRDRSPLHACTITPLDGTGQTVLNQ